MTYNDIDTGLNSDFNIRGRQGTGIGTSAEMEKSRGPLQAAIASSSRLRRPGAALAGRAATELMDPLAAMMIMTEDVGMVIYVRTATAFDVGAARQRYFVEPSAATRAQWLLPAGSSSFACWPRLGNGPGRRTRLETVFEVAVDPPAVGVLRGIKVQRCGRGQRLGFSFLGVELLLRLLRVQPAFMGAITDFNLSGGSETTAAVLPLHAPLPRCKRTAKLRLRVKPAARRTPTFRAERHALELIRL